MKRALISLLIGLLWNCAYAQQPDDFPNSSGGYVQQIPLNASRPYFLPTHPNVTVTLSFPKPIDGYEGAGFTTDASKADADYLLTMTEGNSYLSLVPIGRRTVRNLNVVVEGKVISVIAFPVDDQRTAPTSIVFMEPPPVITMTKVKKEEPPAVVKTFTAPANPFQQVSPARLVGILDTMKMLALLQRQDKAEEAGTGKRGHRLEDAAIAMPHLKIVRRERDVTDYVLYKIKNSMVVRNQRLDVIAFECVIENTSDRDLVFDPESFGIRAGEAFYRAVISDIQPVIKAGQSEIGFFALAGSPDGRPNYLDPEQEFVPSLQLLKPSVNPGAALIRETMNELVAAKVGNAGGTKK